MYLGSFAIDDYLGIPAATHRFSSGAAYAPTVLTYSIYEEATAVGLDEDVDMVVASPFDSVVGCYWIRRQLTAAAGFELGKNYMVLIKATVDSVAAVQMHTFQMAAKVDAVAISGATAAADSVEANIGNLDAAVSAVETDTQDIQSRLPAALVGGAMDSDVSAMQAGTVTATAVATDAIDADALAADAAVQVAAAVWDRILSGATHNIASSAGRRLRAIQEFQGYEDGAIWIDTVNGVAGTTDYENGTVENPVDTIADANTLAASLNINRFRVAPGSIITFAATQSNQVFTGNGWTLALGGQSIVGTTIIGATVSGIASGVGTTQTFEKCLMGACSYIKGTHLLECGIAGTQTLVEAGDFFTDRCHSGVAGTGTPTLDVGAAIGNSNVNFRNYSGGIQLESFGDTGTDTMSLEGRGQLVEGTCTGGTVAIRGHFTVSSITNLTLSDDARIDVAQINAECDTALSDYDPPTKTELDSAFTEIKGPTWASGTDTLEHIRNKQTDIETDTAEIGAAGIGLSAIPDLAGVTTLLARATEARLAELDAANLPADVDAILVDTATSIPALIAALNDLSAAQVNAEVDTALGDYDGPTNAEMEARTLLAANYLTETLAAESYAADGVKPTRSQIAYMIWCAVHEFAISGTTITGKKLDGSTTAMTWTLDDGTNPTSRTRAT